MERNPIRYAENIKNLMHYHLGRSVISEEIHLAKITYYEGGELEEPQEQIKAA